MLPKRIEPVSLEFKDSHTPYSSLFQDIYFAPEIGVHESTHVYLKNSGFIDALAKSDPDKHFNLGEIGFGVGLNFLLTYRHFLANSNQGQKLTYLSAEK